MSDDPPTQHTANTNAPSANISIGAGTDGTLGLTAIADADDIAQKDTAARLIAPVLHHEIPELSKQL